MTERDALLAAILEHPDDDTPRLVYADWLQEHGEDARAEFIRLQCRVDGISAGRKPERLHDRERDLRKKLFGRLTRLGFTKVAVRRGFVRSVTSGVHNFLARAAELTPADAPAFALELGDGLDDSFYDDADIDALAARPELRRCVSLALPCLGTYQGGAILDSPNLTALRRLDFPDNETGPGVHNLARDTFANLRWVNVHNSDSAADCPSIAPLARCPHLANLEHLDFGANEQIDADLYAVGQAAQWSKLRYLSLTCSDFSLTAIADFFATPHLPALRELDLSYTFNDPTEWTTPGNGDPFVERIATSPLLARLSKLWLQGNGVTDDGAKALASAPPAVKLELLDLTQNPISDDARQLLCARFGDRVCVFDGDRRD